jgi:hypothetical protein
MKPALRVPLRAIVIAAVFFVIPWQLGVIPALGSSYYREQSSAITNAERGPLEMVATNAMPTEAPTDQAPISTSGWREFHDPAAGLSFRYPPSLRVREKEPQEFGSPLITDQDLRNPSTGLAQVVDLIGDTPVNTGTIVLSFLLFRETTIPETAAGKIKKAFEFQSRLHEAEIENAPESGRPVCSSLSTIRLDGLEAVLRIDCGRAALHWQIIIMQPRSCLISTGLMGNDYVESVPPPHDGMFPLLSIIRTVHIDAQVMSSPATHR